MTSAQTNFIEKIAKMTKTDYKKHKILPSIVIAQAILESAWGKSGLTVKANNLFGMKAGSSWKGAVYISKTKEEYVKGKVTVITSSFRKYSSWQESVNDHNELLNKDLYKKVKNAKDYKEASKALQTCGYATDKQYANQLIKLIELYKLNKYDKEVLTASTTKTTTIKATVNTKTDPLNLREKASTSSKVLVKIKKGIKVEVIDKNYNKEWSKVKYDGKTGFVMTKYIKF